jgi:hypothetical protein
MNKKFLGWISVMLITFACNIPTSSQPLVFEPTSAQATQANTSASPAPTTAEAATQAPGQLTPDGEIASSGGISFLIPNGMASDATAAATTEVELPYINPGGGDMPQHTKFTLNNYAVKSETMLTPTVIVFKADEFAQYSEMTTAMVSDLHNMQYTDGQPVPQSLASTTLMAQVHGVNFQNGKGIRYLTQIQQAPLPINNHDMFYYYQGITNDGLYYVEVILPVQVPFLASDNTPNTAVPADGIPFNMENLGEYYNTVTQKLNATDTFSFTPYLDHIDSLIQSMQITGL